MTLHHLRVFIKVAECGSVSAAARECHLAQPTVSQLIKELEDFYAARLFERLSKRLYITEEGRRLLSRAKEVAGAYERLEYDMSPDKRRDRLRIGSSVTVGHVPDAVACESASARRGRRRRFTATSTTRRRLSGCCSARSSTWPSSRGACAARICSRSTAATTTSRFSAPRRTRSPRARASRSASSAASRSCCASAGAERARFLKISWRSADAG